MNIPTPHNHQQCQVCCHNFFTHSPISFDVIGEREILAKIVPTDKVEGYDGIMQGGIVTTLHDCAMLHCLFNHDIHAMTVSLASRFHHPIYIGEPLEIRATWVKSKRNIHFLQSQIVQQGKMCSSAQSQFMS
ncbi:PaaI family thioesterase [Vibrio sp. 99-70-13A1]|uniref:PaaI family thioesterase n=1 Tax=Vibrio sp. 99-70-13A1 TaxID=2607601 RepID=UPI001493324C|nr:PaaI family thioesterase [Vibrio sp. 99-70-13A1]NOH95781.1 PaaI family thioesterase [Vibrio sp. 99-70-13A1]